MTRGKSDFVVEAFKEGCAQRVFPVDILLLPDDDFVEHSNGRMAGKVKPNSVALASA